MFSLRCVTRGNTNVRRNVCYVFPLETLMIGLIYFCYIRSLVARFALYSLTWPRGKTTGNTLAIHLIFPVAKPRGIRSLSIWSSLWQAHRKSNVRKNVCYIRSLDPVARPRGIRSLFIWSSLWQVHRKSNVRKNVCYIRSLDPVARLRGYARYPF